MRVISGKYKGRKLTAPDGLLTRPTLDRSKETLFNVIQFDVPHARCLDLFCGSGQIGIEMLSRGAEDCVFADSGQAALNAVRANLRAVGEDDRRVISADFRTVLNTINGPFDIIYADPPFGQDLYGEIVRLTEENSLLSAEGKLICECDRERTLRESGRLKITGERVVGRVKFVFFGREK